MAKSRLTLEEAKSKRTAKAHGTGPNTNKENKSMTMTPNERSKKVEEAAKQLYSLRSARNGSTLDWNKLSEAERVSLRHEVREMAGESLE